MINTLAIITGNTLAILIVGVLMLNLPYGFTKGSLQSKIFVSFSWFIVLGAVFGMGSAFFDGMPGSVARFCVVFFGSGGIILPTIMSFDFWLYVESTGKHSLQSIKTSIIIASIPVALLAVLVFVNLFNPLLFYVSSDNIYSRGPLGLISYVMGPAYLVVSLSRIAYFKSKRRGFLFVPLAGVITPIFVVGVIQVSFYGVMQSWMGFAIGMLTLYIGTHKDLLYSDSMTRVFNRMYLEYIIEDAKVRHASLGGIMIDVDHFKFINDTLGHGMGDEVLKKTAGILKKSVDENTNVIRAGGDEFMVVGDVDNEDELHVVMERIRENCKIESEKKTIPVAIELSMGCGIFAPESESDSDWLARMDKNMYTEKSLHRRERRGTRRVSNNESL